MPFYENPKSQFIQKFSNIQLYFLCNSSVTLHSRTVLHTFTH